MRALHVLDHSIPLHSGHTFCTLALLREQRALCLTERVDLRRGERKAQVG